MAGKDIHALALSLYAGAALARGAETSVLIPGGDVNNEDLAIWGAAAVETVLSMRFDLAFIGVCACDPSVGVMSPNLNEATLKRAVFQRRDALSSLLPRKSFPESRRIGLPLLIKWIR
ncbi:hypothetical protein [Corynebacterium pseudotuberculosis]|uniref:hypothetical protein n=1 Tax=Corynebacterium pseudotuberculosis TaxID=1719 RepID=UPI000A601B91|nr:hypothetical protein [Corynebacterium pseudotuberculosis]